MSGLVCILACICQHSHHHTATVCKAWSVASWSLPCLLHAPACNSTSTSCIYESTLEAVRPVLEHAALPQGPLPNATECQNSEKSKLTAGQYHALVLSAGGGVLAPCSSTHLKLLDRSWLQSSMHLHSCIRYQLLDHYTKLHFHPV